MMENIQGRRRRIAAYKIEPTRSLPMRPGPLQCIRNCSNCVPNVINGEMIYPQVDSLNIKTFDNLLIRTGKHSSSYHSIQYHSGQLDVLKQARKVNPCKLFIYIVALNKDTDVDYFKFVLEHGKSDIKFDLPLPEFFFYEDRDTIREYLWPNFYLNPDKNNITILVQRTTCVVRTSQRIKSYFDIEEIRDFLNTLMGIISDEGKEFDSLIVPVSVTKDHDIVTKFGYGCGSVAVQIMEPFLLSPCLKFYTESLDMTNMTVHLYYDLFHNAIILAPNMVAFLILFLHRPEVGIQLHDLEVFMKWFIDSAIDIDLHYGFSGHIDDSIDYSLVLLQPYIKQNINGSVLVKNEDGLMDYANIVIPIVAYYGIIARSIIIEHNIAKPDEILTNFDENVGIEVNKDKVLKTAVHLGILLESTLPCKKPCITIEARVNEVFEQMSRVRRFFQIKQANNPYKVGWTGDIEVDENYSQSFRENYHFEPSLVVTKNVHRLDRLNLFMNAINSYII